MDAQAVYSEKSDYYRDALRQARVREDWCANGRFVVFTLTLVMGWWLYDGEAAHLLPCLAPIGVFLVLATFHASILQTIVELERGQAYFARGLARLAGDWRGAGNCSTVHEPPGHVFARDLDLFGPGSLFDLLDTTFTSAGERQLAEWLLSLSSVSEIERRQDAVRELSEALGEREAMALFGETQSSAMPGGGLGNWAKGIRRDSLSRLKKASLSVAVAVVVINCFTFFGFLPNSAYFVWLLGAWALYRCSRDYRSEAALSFAGIEPDLLALEALLRVQRTQKPASELLQSLDAILFESDANAKQLLAKLSRIGTLRDAQRNQFFAPVAFLLLWDPLFTVLIEGWRQAYGEELFSWVRAAGKRDALLALATFHFENPTYAMPAFVENNGDEPVFEAEGIGHPFLRSAERVVNDLSLGATPLVLMLSGSNMSGKSTLLRTVGINVALALAGTCACASALRLTPLHLGGTLRVHDSLEDGRSRFYAEIERLAELLAIAKGNYSLLFLVDEIFHGTNSAARSTGAKRLIEEFIERKAIGIVTTHDLSLADAVQSMALVQNIHLRDLVVEGELLFDFKIQPGILKEGNALHLMRAVGLPI